jgi:hypothetical protein
MNDLELLRRRRLDHLSDTHDVSALIGRQSQPKLRGIGDDVKHAAIGHVDLDGAELGYFDRGVEMDGKAGKILERHPLHLAVLDFGSDRNQPRRGLQGQLSDRLFHRHHSRFEESGHHADGVGAGHGRIFGLFHDDETGVRFGKCGRQDEIAVRGRKPPWLAQHAFTEIVRLRLEVFHFLEHRFAGDVAHAPHDDSAGLATAVEIHGIDHACQPHPSPSSRRCRAYRKQQAKDNPSGDDAHDDVVRCL